MQTLENIELVLLRKTLLHLLYVLLPGRLKFHNASKSSPLNIWVLYGFVALLGASSEAAEWRWWTTKGSAEPKSSKVQKQLGQ